MSGLWNPYAFSVTGQPLAPPTPPALRVYGSQASEAQLAMAQHAFARFCSTSRLSAVINPTERGRLADGTEYRIVVLGNTPIMEVWPSGSNSDLLRSGIAVAFGDLAGIPLEAYMTDGESTVYLLTPKVRKDTRVATGEWGVQKLTEPKGGGKAVNAGSTGRTYFTGVQGRGETDYPTSPVAHGSVNERAYAVEDRDTLRVFRNGSDVGVSQHPESPLPFVLEWSGGKKYAAQLVLRRTEDGGTAVDLLVGPIATNPGEPVGSVVDTVIFSADTSVPWWKISICPDGREARALSFAAGIVCKVTFHMTPETISYSSSGCKTNEGRTTRNYAPPINSSTYVQTNTGTGGDGSLLIAQTAESNHNIMVNGAAGEISLPQSGSWGTGVYMHEGSPSYVYAFGPKGQEVETEVDGKRTTTTSRQHYTSAVSTLSVWGPGGSWTRRTVREVMDVSVRTTVVNAGSELADFIGEDMVGTVTHDEVSNYDFSSVSFTPQFEDSVTTTSGSGSGRETTRSASSINAVYFDRYLGFAIYTEFAPATRTHTWVLVPPSKVRVPTGSTESEDQATLIVKYRGGVVMKLALDPANVDIFVAYSASDPMTGAIVVNLQRLERLPDRRRRRLASWIFLVDDAGIKTIQDVFPGLPKDTCVKENKLLYSL